MTISKKQQQQALNLVSKIADPHRDSSQMDPSSEVVQSSQYRWKSKQISDEKATSPKFIFNKQASKKIIHKLKS